MCYGAITSAYDGARLDAADVNITAPIRVRLPRDCFSWLVEAWSRSSCDKRFDERTCFVELWRLTGGQEFENSHQEFDLTEEEVIT